MFFQDDTANRNSYRLCATTKLRPNGGVSQTNIDSGGWVTRRHAVIRQTSFIHSCELCWLRAPPDPLGEPADVGDDAHLAKYLCVRYLNIEHIIALNGPEATGCKRALFLRPTLPGSLFLCLILDVFLS